MAKSSSAIQTLVVDNFRGSLTYYPFGDINSGRGDIRVNAGANPFLRPGSLTWMEAATQIDPGGSVITDLILDGKERVESGILYVYAIGHTGRVYKIQVNDPNTYNPDYDNPVLLATITSGSPTFTRGGFIDFFGSTERMYIGHDKGVTRLDFDGTGESALSATWTQNVPRPLRQFVGKLYVGNGANIAEIDSTGLVTTSTKLSPAFPTGTQARDMDYSIDGNYLEIVVAQLALADMTSSTQQTGSTSSSPSYIFKWNGTDVGYTTFDFFPRFALSANTTFQDYQYVFGVDQFGTAIYNPSEKFTMIPEMPSVQPNAVSSSGNLLTWMGPLQYLGVLESDFLCWGHVDWEVGQQPTGYWDLFFINAKAPETDIISNPFQMVVSNQGIGASSNGYPGNIFGTSKIYFSTLETSGAPSTAYRFYKWRFVTTPTIEGETAVTPIIGAVYQTQTQMFSKRVLVREVRVYADPWIDGNSFEISLIGGDGESITGTTRTFDTADGTLTAGEDFVWYNPQMQPSYALGLRVMNMGTTNHMINKVEIDYAFAGE